VPLYCVRKVRPRSFRRGFPLLTIPISSFWRSLCPTNRPKTAPVYAPSCSTTAVTAPPQADAKIRNRNFHAKREQEWAEEMGLRFARFLDGDVQTACDLGATFAMLFVWTASVYLSPQTANSLTRLGQLMLKTHSLVKAEFVSTWQETWPQVVASAE
jgi:hypothetical protein